MSEQPDDPATTVYGRLLWHHMDAMRKKDEAKRERIFAAIDLFYELWPAECKVWDDRYDTKPDGLVTAQATAALLEAERERCAKIADGWETISTEAFGSDYFAGVCDTQKHIAAAIRAERTVE